jgi:hypothetical protein
MEPRMITLPVTFRVGSLPTLGPVAGPQQEWASREDPERPGRRYGLTIGAGGNTRIAARARHGDRRLHAHADLAPFIEALFDKLAAMLEVPVFACCDQPQPDLAGVCGSCRAELDADQLRALVECEHPAVADEPAGERSPCPDCGLVWCQAMAAANVQYHEVGGMTLASYDGAAPCERLATRARQDGMTVCTAHQAGDEILGVKPTRR